MKTRSAEGKAIFDEIREPRSARSRVWSLVGGSALECALLVSLVVVYEISSFQDSTARALAGLRAELANYRIVLIAPTSIPGRPPPEPKPPARPRRRTVPPDPLERLEARMASFVRSNPGLEKIVTRELVPDTDSRVLDLGKLLQKTIIRVRFRIDEAGRMADAQLDTSSGVASIDHLALELVGLLEKYRVLAPMKGLENVLATIRIEEDVEVRLEGEAPAAEAAEEMRKQLESVIGLLRLALARSEAVMLLEDVAITASERQVVLQKSFEKGLLVTFLTQLTGEKAEKPQPKP